MFLVIQYGFREGVLKLFGPRLGGWSLVTMVLCHLSPTHLLLLRSVL